jgi:hypothetical protein
MESSSAAEFVAKSPNEETEESSEKGIEELVVASGFSNEPPPLRRVLWGIGDCQSDSVDSGDEFSAPVLA